METLTKKINFEVTKELGFAINEQGKEAIFDLFYAGRIIKDDKTRPLDTEKLNHLNELYREVKGYLSEYTTYCSKWGDFYRKHNKDYNNPEGKALDAENLEPFKKAFKRIHEIRKYLNKTYDLRR